MRRALAAWAIFVAVSAVSFGPYADARINGKNAKTGAQSSERAIAHVHETR